MSQQPEALRLANELDSWVGGFSGKAADLLRSQHAEIERLRDELETERIRLAVCGVVALSDTPESAAKAREMKDQYRSASLSDVARRVDECMALLAENERLRAELEALRKQEPVAWMNVRNGFICKKPTNADYQQPLYLAPGAQPAPETAYLLRDLASDLGVGNQELVAAIRNAKLGDYSINMALPADVCSTMRQKFTAAPEAPKRKPLTDEQIDAIRHASAALERIRHNNSTCHSPRRRSYPRNQGEQQ